MMVPYRVTNKHTENSLQGSQTLFQKRAASRHTSSVPRGGAKSPPRVITSGATNDASMELPGGGGNNNNNVISPNVQSLKLQTPTGVKQQQQHHQHGEINSGSDDPIEMGLDGEDDDGKDDDDLDESGDGSGGPYEVEEGAGNGVENPKGKGKKGLPAKNLMAERRRRKKLNDRLYMLRSVVPKITKVGGKVLQHDIESCVCCLHHWMPSAYHLHLHCLHHLHTICQCRQKCFDMVLNLVSLVAPLSLSMYGKMVDMTDIESGVFAPLNLSSYAKTMLDMKY